MRNEWLVGNGKLGYYYAVDDKLVARKVAKINVRSVRFFYMDEEGCLDSVK